LSYYPLERCELLSGDLESKLTKSNPEWRKEVEKEHEWCRSKKSARFLCIGECEHYLKEKEWNLDVFKAGVWNEGVNKMLLRK